MDQVQEFFDRKRREQALDVSVKEGMRRPASQLAADEDLANRAGVPRYMVEDPQAKPDFEWQAKVMNTPIGELLGTAPRTARYLASDPDNVTAHQNGLSTLQQLELKMDAIEKHRREVEEANRKAGVGFWKGLAVDWAKGTNVLTQVPMNLAEALTGYLGSKEQLASFQALRKSGGMVTILGGVGAADVFGRMNLDYLESGPQRVREQVLVKDDQGREVFNAGAMNPFRLSGLENIASFVAGEAPAFAATAILAYATGGTGTVAMAPQLARWGRMGTTAMKVLGYATRPTAALEVARTVSGIYDDGKRDLMAKTPGLSEADAGAKAAPGALLAGLFSFAAGAPMEAKFFDDLVGQIAKTPSGFGFANQLRARGKALFAAGSKEGIQETVQGLGEDLAKWITFQPDMTIKQVAANALQNFVGGFAMGGPTGGVAAGSQAINTAQHREFFDALHKGATESEAYKLMPKRWQDAIQAVTQGGPLETVGIPIQAWQTYYQKAGIDPVQAAVELGVTPESYAEAVALGDDIHVNTAAFGTKVVGTDAYPALAEDIRYAPGLQTEREARESSEKVKAEVERLMAEVSKPEHPLAQQSAQLRDEMVAAGRPKTEADAAAQLWTKAVTNLAAREGLDPAEFASMYKLSVTDQGPIVELAQMAQGTDTGRLGGTDGQITAGAQPDAAGNPRQGVRRGIPGSDASLTSILRGARAAEDAGLPNLFGAPTFGARSGAPQRITELGTGPASGLTISAEDHGDMIAVVTNELGQSGLAAHIVGMVRGNTFLVGAMNGEGLRAVGTDLYSALGRYLAENHPEVQFVVGLAGGTLENPTGIRRVRDSFDGTQWDGNWAGTPVQALAQGPRVVEDRPMMQRAAFQSREGGPNPTSMAVTHYSPQQGLEALDPAFYGKGTRGAESRRLEGLPSDSPLRQRVHFYPVNPDGTAPRPEGLVTGRNIYQVTLGNLYDIQADPDGIRAGAADANAMEQAVIDAGYDGYWAPRPGANGSVVLLGTEPVPVQPFQEIFWQRAVEDTADRENRVGAIVGGKPGEMGWTFYNAEVRDRLEAQAQRAEAAGNAEEAAALRERMQGMPLEPPPIAGPVLKSPSMARLGPAVRKILTAPAFRKMLSEVLGISGAGVVQVEGSWLGKPEPSFIIGGEGMTFEQAAELSKLLGFAFSQDAVVTTMPRTDASPDDIPAAYIGSRKRMTPEQLQKAREKAMELGIDYTTTQDGKGIKFLYFGSEADYPAYTDKVEEVRKAAGLTETLHTAVRSELHDTATGLPKALEDARGEGLQAGAAGPSALFRRTVDLLLAPYARAVAGEGYRFDPERFGERYGLSEGEVAYITKALLPKDGASRSTVALMEGTESLDVEGTGPQGSTSVTDLMYALQNRAAQLGQIQPGDYSPEARKVMAQAITEEITYHLNQPGGKSAIGWYDAALKRAKAKYAEVFPELKTDPDKGMLFDAFLGITSQGLDVHTNAIMASRVYQLVAREGKTIPQAVEALGGSFGNKSPVIEENLLKLNELIERNGFDRMWQLFNKTMTVGEWNATLRKDETLFFGGSPIKMSGAKDQKVTGWMVFGPKIGSFINNLHGDYSTLTADLWFTRSWNRLLGFSFIHTPEREAQNYLDFRRALVAELEKTTEPKEIIKGKPKAWLHGQDMPDMTQEELEALLNDPDRMLALAQEIEAKFRKGLGWKGEKIKGKGGYSTKSDLRRAAKNWIELREDAGAAPRGDLERSFQQQTMEDAQKLVKRKTGETLTIADMQAALWYHEKDLFGKFGATNTASAPADYEDASARMLEVFRRGDLFRNEGGKLVHGEPGYYLTEEQRQALGDTLYQGKPLGPVDTNSAAFKAWFGDSKVVDENGKPLVVYHGTGRNVGRKGELVSGVFDAFDPSMSGMSSKTGAPEGSFFFTDAPDVASSYTVAWRGDFSERLKDNANVVPVYLDIERPLILDAKGKNWREIRYKGEIRDINEVVEMAKVGGKHDGLIVRRVVDKGVGDTASKYSTTYVAFEPTQIKSATSNTGDFDPDNPSILAQQQDDPRGYLQIGEKHTFRLGLLDGANASTVVHELGHFYLSVMADLASREGSSEVTKKDYQTILEAYGSDDGQGGKKLDRAAHERFADAHLLYLAEGGAASEDVRGAFQRFSRWLGRIWGTVKRDMVNVRLTKEVRDVFDRLYASEQEVEAARADLGEVLFATAEEAGMTEAEFAIYREAERKHIAEAKERMVKALMAELAKEQTAERKAFAAAVLARVTAEVQGRQEYVALAALTSGKTLDGVDVKLSKEALASMGVDLKSLPKEGILTVYAAQGGAHPDAVAPFLGYETGADLVQALQQTEPRKALIARLTKEEVQARYPDTMENQQALREMAMDKLHEGGNADRVLALELRSIRRAKASAAPAVKLAQAQAAAEQKDEKQRAVEAVKTPDLTPFRIAAENMVKAAKAFELSPWRYLQAQRKASREAKVALAKGDFEAAEAAKEREILARFLYSESLKAQARVERFVAFDRKFDVRRFREKIGKAGGTFMAQIDALRQRFGLSGRGIESMAVGKRENLEAWAQAQDFAEIDDRILDETWSKPYQTMTVDELDALHGALRNIRTLAYAEVEILADGRRVELETVETDIASTVAAHNKLTNVPRSTGPQTLLEKAKLELMGWDASMRKIQAVINLMDGGNVMGPANRYIWQPLARAQAERYDLQRLIGEPLRQAVRKLPAEIRRRMSDTVVVDGMGSYTRAEILSMAFNSGNAENRRKLLEGRGWNGAQLAEALSHLTKAELEFVQETWDIIETLWPKMVELEKRWTGVEPVKVQPEAFTVYGRDGQPIAEMRGGYFPLKYDPDDPKTNVGRKQETASLIPENYGRVGTSRSALKERTKFTGAVLLDFRYVLDQHVNDVIMDLTHRQPLADAQKVLNRPVVKDAIQQAFGTEAYRQFDSWLKTIAGDSATAAALGLSKWNRLVMGLRTHTTAAVLGLKWTSMIVQVSDAARLMAPGEYRVPAGRFAAAFTQFLASPVQTTRMVRELSAMMKHRPEHLDRDIHAILKQATGQQSLKDRWNRAAFKGLAWMDTLISVPGWLGAYQASMAEHGDSDRAVLEADRTVEMRLQTGSPKDLVGVQRSNEVMKLLTMYMGDSVAGYNLMRQALSKGSPLQKFGRFTMAAATLMVVAMLGDLLKGQGPDDDDDEVKWMMRKAALAPLGTVPLLRDASRALDKQLNNEPFADYEFTPAIAGIRKGLAAIEITADMLGSEKDVDGVDWAIKSAEGIGYALGIGGTAQVAGAAKYIQRVERGEENPENEFEAFMAALENKPRKGTR